MKFFPAIVPLFMGCLMAPQSPEAQVVNPDFVLTARHDSRVVRDVAALQLDQIAPEQTWLVAEIKPDKDSYSGKLVGAYIDQTGKLVQVPGARVTTMIRVHGAMKPIAVLAGTPNLSEKYSWEFEERGRRRDRSEEGNYPIFRLEPGGTAVFRINEPDKNAEQEKEEQDEDVEVDESVGPFSPVYLIPDEWAPFVAPALKYIRENGELFKPAPTSERQAKLQPLLSDENPFIAISAAQALKSAYFLDVAAAHKTIVGASGWRQSVFVYLLLQQSSYAERFPALPANAPPTAETLTGAIGQALQGEPLTAEVSRIIGAAQEAQTLKSLAIGIRALSERSHGNPLIANERNKKLLGQVAKRQAVLNTRTAADLYLEQLLGWVGIKKVAVP